MPFQFVSKTCLQRDASFIFVKHYLHEINTAVFGAKQHIKNISTERFISENNVCNKFCISYVTVYTLTLIKFTNFSHWLVQYFCIINECVNFVIRIITVLFKLNFVVLNTGLKFTICHKWPPVVSFYLLEKLNL